jgi:hypothetical protein
MPTATTLKTNAVIARFMLHRLDKWRTLAELIGIKNWPDNGWSPFRGALVSTGEMAF